MQGLPQTGAMLNVLNHSPGANAPATKIVAAATDDYWSVQWLTASFDANPASAVTLDIVVGGTTLFAVDIAAAGVHHFTFPGGLYGSKNENVVITLPAGGAGVTGKIGFGYL